MPARTVRIGDYIVHLEVEALFEKWVAVVEKPGSPVRMVNGPLHRDDADGLGAPVSPAAERRMWEALAQTAIQRTLDETPGGAPG